MDQVTGNRDEHGAMDAPVARLGFTGVDWDLRPAEQLAADLHTGAGPVPQVEAGAAWLAIAAAISAVGIDYAGVLNRLRDTWESAGADDALAHLTGIADWLADLAAASTAAASRAHTHAAQVAVARLAMPAPAEIDTTNALHAAATSPLATGAAALAPMILGAAAQAERAQRDQQLRAGRVMAEYERAAEPIVAARWAGRPAPQLVKPVPKSTPTPAVVDQQDPAPVIPAAMGPIVMPAVRPTHYAPTVVASVGAAPAVEQPRPAATASSNALSPGMPLSSGMPPPAAMLGARDASHAERTTASGGPAAQVAASEPSAEPVHTWADVACASTPVSTTATGQPGPTDKPLGPEFAGVPGLGGDHR